MVVVFATPKEIFPGNLAVGAQTPILRLTIVLGSYDKKIWLRTASNIKNFSLKERICRIVSEVLMEEFLQMSENMRLSFMIRTIRYGRSVSILVVCLKIKSVWNPPRLWCRRLAESISLPVWILVEHWLLLCETERESLYQKISIKKVSLTWGGAGGIWRLLSKKVVEVRVSTSSYG